MDTDSAVGRRHVVWQVVPGPCKERGRGGGKLPRAPRHLGAPPPLKNIKYTRMHHLKTIRIFFLKGLLENVFPGPAQRVWVIPQGKVSLH